MAHIVPHWSWPEREGLVTPVHVFTSGDEAELFLNGRSLGSRFMTRSPIKSLKLDTQQPKAHASAA
jgi:hypothetical protein